MKRGWEAQPPTYGQSSSEARDDAVWVSMPSHPYASAYNNMPNPFPSTLGSADQQYDPAFYAGSSGHTEKKPRFSEGLIGDGSDLGRDEDEDGDDDDDDDDDDGDDDNVGGGKGGAGKGKGGRSKGGEGKKVKLTRGSRACIACRRIKMRCIPDESSGPGGPCKRCKSGGHECIFEESNRGKRSTRKNEAMAAKMARMEQALKSMGAALSNLDQPSLNSFSNALHSVTGDQDVINVITSHTSPSTVPTLAVAMNRMPYSGQDEFGYNTGSHMDSAPNAHLHQPPLSPRLHSLPDNVLSPLGLLAEASLQNTDGKKHLSHSSYGKPSHRPSPLSMGSERTGVHVRNGGSSMGGSSPSYRMATSDVRGNGSDSAAALQGRGVASQNYFRPGEQMSVPALPVAGSSDERLPELLTIVSREEINELFDIYYNCMAPHVPMIYREFHTPELVLQRSQFLCTVIAAIAARYYTKRPELHAQLSTYAKRLAFEVPSRGYKSVEVCQAYLLLSVWTLGPEKTFEQDRTWLMLGMAIRMATDLNLHRKSITSGLDTEEGRARDLEIINRERCWLHCFILDRSISAQMGKPYTIREDYIIRNACEASWHQQRYSLPTDRAVSAYAVLQQIMSRAIDSIYSSTTTVSGLRQDCDYMLIVRSAHEELRRWLTEWNKPDTREGDPKSEYDSRAQFYFAYHSLVLYSFGLENALVRAKMDISFFLTNVYEAATRVCTVVKEDFLPKGFLGYLPDTNFVMCSYALLSLLKLLKPELRPFHDSEEAIFKLVSEMADVLEDCAVDASHQPAIYAAFIREIVRKTKEARRGPTAPPTRVGSPTPGNEQLANGETQTLDPSLLDQTATWQPDDMLEGQQFTFIPQGGDMMILPSQAGPSESVINSPTTAFPAYINNTNGTPQASGTGWAEYLPTYMSSDGFDGWDGSMLLPGFGRGQITLGGGLLHSQYGSGIITPAQHTPVQSRSGSRVASRATSPVR
ncbi:fungal-specific transcription factor domain-domain-containing protein [Naematelia encephala]|uniref:Fungal-specific transcription factor domain-domain-containing protein n=1 Tax=Naematelia encephala TaxID=71784 RepID=A0A1Y2BIP7_9TREE|nr:fungal-specific transcription factor domain-domain-containing protein [Naematelia encephala]